MNEKKRTLPCHFRLEDGLMQIPGPNGERSAVLLRHGTLRLGTFAPRGQDPQQPHAQDEIYVVAQGHGFFVAGDERVEFSTGDLLFAPAGVLHRFESFSNDLVLWVVFFGPDGGETP